MGVFSCLDFLNLALSLGLWVTAPHHCTFRSFVLDFVNLRVLHPENDRFSRGPSWLRSSSHHFPPFSSAPSQSEEVHRTHCSTQVVECQSLRPSQHHFAGLSEPGPWGARWSWVKLKPPDFPVMSGRMPRFLEKHLQQTNPKPTTG